MIEVKDEREPESWSEKGSNTSLSLLITSTYGKLEFAHVRRIQVTMRESKVDGIITLLNTGKVHRCIQVSILSLSDCLLRTNESMN